MIEAPIALFLCLVALILGAMTTLAVAIVINQHRVEIVTVKTAETMFAEQFFILNIVQYIHLKLIVPQKEYQWREVLRVLNSYGLSNHYQPNPHLKYDPIGSLLYGLMCFVQDEETKNNIHDVVSFIRSESSTHELNVPIDLDPRVVALGVAQHPLLK